MKMLPLLLVGTVVVVSGVVAYQSHQQNQQTQLALQTAQAERDTDHGSAIAREAQLQSTIDTLRRDMSALQQQLAAAQAGTSSGGMVMQGQSSQPAATQPAQPANSVAEMLRRQMSTPEGRASQIESRINSEYGEFIAALELPEADRKQLIDLIRGVFEKRQELSGRVARGEISRDQQRAAVNNDMANAVAAILSPEEMEVFHDYEVAIPERARVRMASFTRLMLETDAPGLTADNRALVADTLSTFMTNQQPTINAQGVATSNVEEVYKQTELVLQGKLEAQQMEIARQYLEQQIRKTTLLNQ
jgi:hypothetical protein